MNTQRSKEAMLVQASSGVVGKSAAQLCLARLVAFLNGITMRIEPCHKILNASGAINVSSKNATLTEPNGVIIAQADVQREDKMLSAGICEKD